MGASGVRLEECVELYQEESTQRASMRNVNNIDRYCAEKQGEAEYYWLHRSTHLFLIF